MRTALSDTSTKKQPKADAGRSSSFVDLGRALRYLRPYVLPFAGAFISLLAVTGATLVSPQFIRLLIDRGLPHYQAVAGQPHVTVLVDGSWKWIIITSSALVGVAMVRGVFNFLQGYLAEKASQGVAFDLRNVLFSKLQNLSFSYHDQVQTGQLMTRMTSDVEYVRTFAGQGLLTLLSSVFTLVGTLIVLFVLDVRLGGVSFAMVPLTLAIFAVLVTRVFPLFRRIQQRLGGLNTILQENLAGVTVVKAFTREPYEYARYDAANQDLLVENLKVITAISVAFPVIFLVANLANLAVVWYGGGLVIGGNLSLGTLVAFSTYLAFLLMPIFQLGFTSQTMSRAGASSARVFEVLDAESEVRDRPGAKSLVRIEGRVAFDHVSFRYAGQDKNILDDVSFTVEPGETVALVGTTGSGKSTLINLIPRFYDVREGAVKIDDVDIRDVTLSSLRSNIGIALQESTLFGGSLRENIAFGRPDATLEEIRAAAKAAKADDFIASFPDGYDTVVGERGVTLSGGQRQRVSIARTLLVNPRILLLDDATSSVDAETEYRMQQALDGLMEGRTSLVIAHRVSTVRRANRILVLDGGTLAADGTHDELLESSPLYGEIVDSQLDRSIAPAAVNVDEETAP